MKSFTWQTWVILGLTVIVILGIIFWPKPTDEGKRAYEDTLKSLRQEKAVIQSMQEATIKGYIARVKIDSSNVALQENKIQALERRGVIERVKVETIIQENPDLLSFVNTQSEVIQELKVERDTLKSQLAFRDKMYTDLVSNEYIEDKIEDQMQLQASIRIADLEKQVKRRKSLAQILKGIGKGLAIGGAGYVVGRAVD